jgi:hypothetical protein
LLSLFLADVNDDISMLPYMVKGFQSGRRQLFLSLDGNCLVGVTGPRNARRVGPVFTRKEARGKVRTRILVV